MKDAVVSIGNLREKVARFIRKREWEQFHSPKNLSMSIGIEAAELMEIFQWMDVEEARAQSLVPEMRRKIEEEIADIAIYVLSLCNTLGMDLSSCIMKKIDKNRKRFPIKKCKGKWL